MPRPMRDLENLAIKKKKNATCAFYLSYASFVLFTDVDDVFVAMQWKIGRATHIIHKNAYRRQWNSTPTI